MNIPKIKSLHNYEDGMRIQKQLLSLRQYIYNYICKKIPEKKRNSQIKEYMEYLKKEIDVAKNSGMDTDSFEINYLFSFFPKGITFIANYDIFECVYYNTKKNNKISGKAIIPSPEFKFKIDTSKIAVKFFDFEFEIEDLDDIKSIMTRIYKIIEEKLKTAQLLIEPCFTQVRSEIEKKENQEIKVKKKTIPNKIINNNSKDLVQNLIQSKLNTHHKVAKIVKNLDGDIDDECEISIPEMENKNKESKIKNKTEKTFNVMKQGIIPTLNDDGDMESIDDENTIKNSKRNEGMKILNKKANEINSNKDDIIEKNNDDNLNKVQVMDKKNKNDNNKKENDNTAFRNIKAYFS